MPTAAHKLNGLPLAGGWTPTQLLPTPPGKTGGCFSVGYKAVHTGGRTGFLKALDFAGAFRTQDPARLLQAMLLAFNFERDTLDACRTKRLDRVVTPLAHGTVQVPGYPVGAVPYLIFEMAAGDIRTHLEAATAFDVSWRLKSLHHVAVGLQQLHGVGIAHQDLKPSNVLLFDDEGSRIADLGAASRQGTASPNDEYRIAGDETYAPPELLYAYTDPDWHKRRVGCDLYHLGSLMMFLFCGVSMTHALMSALDPALHPGTFGGPYSAVLPHVRDAFNRVLGAFTSDAREFAPAQADELAAMIRRLCDPDPELRGDLRRRGTGMQHSLERYISRLDAIRYKARIGTT